MNNDEQWSPESIAGIIEHMNEDHADAVDLYLKAFGNAPAGCSQVKMTSINATGITLSYQSEEGMSVCNILFADAEIKSPLRNLSESRAALVALVGNARKKLSVQ
ncbi:MAG: DUF2470 domain-containing protein [Granulosicoccus sp.]